MDVRLRPKQSSRPWVQLAKLLTSHSAEEMKELTNVPPGSPWADATPSAPANATSRIASLDAPTIQGGSFGLLVLRAAPQCRRDLLQSNLHVSFPSPAEPRPLSHSYAVSPRLATHPSRQLALPTQPSSATERHLDLCQLWQRCKCQRTAERRALRRKSGRAGRIDGQWSGPPVSRPQPVSPSIARYPSAPRECVVSISVQNNTRVGSYGGCAHARRAVVLTCSCVESCDPPGALHSRAWIDYHLTTTVLRPRSVCRECRDVA